MEVCDVSAITIQMLTSEQLYEACIKSQMATDLTNHWHYELIADQYILQQHASALTPANYQTVKHKDQCTKLLMQLNDYL